MARSPSPTSGITRAWVLSFQAVAVSAAFVGACASPRASLPPATGPTNAPSAEAVPEAVAPRAVASARLRLPSGMPAASSLEEAETAIRPHLGLQRPLATKNVLYARKGALVEAGFDEDKLLAYFLAIATPCLSAPIGSDACAVGAFGPTTEAHELLQWLDGALANTGSVRGARLLQMLEQRGRTTRLARLLANRAEQAGEWLRKPCASPTPEQVLPDLHDFLVIEPRGASFESRPLRAAERADLAYFLSAVGTDRGPPLPPVQPGDPPPELRDDALADDAFVESAQAYLRARGVELRASALAWGSLRLFPASIVHRLGLELELRGAYDAAASLYRGALGAEGDDAAGGFWVHGALARVGDARDGCRPAIAIRMFRADGDGLAGQRLGSLTFRGVDVARLYRGAALTTDRHDLARRAPAFLQGKPLATVLARQARWGDEDWADRLRVLPSLGNVAPTVAVPLLLRRAANGPAEARAEAVQILASLVARRADPACRRAEDLSAGVRVVVSNPAFPPIGPAEEICGFRWSPTRLKEIAAVAATSSTAGEGALRAAGQALGNALELRKEDPSADQPDDER